MSYQPDILVVDDTTESLALLSRTLTDAGYRVRPADSGELALAAVDYRLPDLILLDIRMPGIDGFEVCRRLKANPGTRRIPVIFITVATDVEDRVAGLRLGAADYVPKPIEPAELLARVRAHLELARLHREAEEHGAALEAANKTLRENEALLHATEKLAKVGGWEWDVDERTMRWTKEVYRIHDIDPAEIEPLSQEHVARSLECYGSEGRPVIVAAFERCATRGEPYDLEFPFRTAKGRQLWIRTAAHPIMDKGRVVRVAGHIMDITERKQAENEREKLITELRQALAEIKTLKGLIPICAGCKKVRDDKGFWTQVETYIMRRTDARFSHGLCPDCMRMYYPDFEEESTTK